MKKIALFFLSLLLLPQLVFARTSNDPYIDQWSYRDVKAFQAWDYNTGSSDVVVAVIDNGFDTFHPDLFENVWKNTREISGNGIDDDNNGYVDDIWGWNFVQVDTNGDGHLDRNELKGNNDPRPNTLHLTDHEKRDGTFNHGTVVAGIIGAVGNNSQNGGGVSWKVKLMNLKVVDNNGTGNLALLGPAIRYAVDNGASIINVSMVGNFLPLDVLDAVQYAHKKGVAIFAAAGNDARLLDEDPRYPICADANGSQMVIGVSAIDEAHKLARFSNFGSKCIDITAPGVNILSILRYDLPSGLIEQYGGPWHGTSFATPFVTGAAALIKSIQPTWKAPEIYNALLSTVHKTPPIDDVVYTHLFGKGLLQIDKAVAYAQAGNPVSQPTQPQPVVTPVTPQVPSVTSQPQQPSPNGQTIVEPLSVLIFNDANAKGEIYKYGIANGFGAPLESKNMVYLQGLESLSRHKNDNTESTYGVLYFRNDGNSIVRLYNKNFERLGGFKKNLSYASTLVVADVVGDSEPEIILAPKVSDTLLFSVHDKYGKDLFRVNAKEKHVGVSITRKYNPQTKKDEIAVLYKQGSRVFLSEYKDGNVKSHERELSPKTEIGGLFFGDVNGDNVGEYAMVVTIDTTVWVRYYDAAGNFLRRVPVFQFMNKEKKINVTFDDFDSDGKYEIMMNEKYGGRGVYGVLGMGDEAKLLTTLKNAFPNNYFVVPFVK